MIKLFILISFIFFNAQCMGMEKSKEFIFPQGTLAAIAPPVINKDYFLFEFGFVTEKKIKSWNYDYNAYVTAAIFQDTLDQTAKLKAGGLGFKGGVFLPTQPWIPLLASLTIGYVKTDLHDNPFFGKADKSADRKDMFLAEAGALYHIDKYFLRFAYQISNVKYFHRHTFFMLGVSY